MQTIAVSLSDAHNISIDIIEGLMEANVAPVLAVSALALTLGRCANPSVSMTHEQEIQFIQDAILWVQTYWITPEGVH